MGIALIASGALVVLAGRGAQLGSFHGKNLALWGGVAAGGAMSAAFLGSGIGYSAVLIAAGWAIRGWVASGILGSCAVIAVRRAQRPDDSEPESDMAERGDASGQSLFVRAARSALGWLSRRFRHRTDHGHFRRGELNRALTQE